MQIITLTTDFGTKSFDVAALKGKLMCASPNINIIDISHDIAVFDTIKASYELKNAAKNFPPNTFHFTNINLKEGNNRFLLVEQDNQIFLCPDNGIITLMFPDEKFKAYFLKDLEKDFTYSDVDKIICKIIASQLNNEDMLKFATFTNSYFRSALVKPAIMEDIIRASIIYVDQYNNVVVNIDKKTFYNFIGDKPYTISLRSGKAHKINKHYSEAAAGEMVCIFNDAGLLEIAINTGEATKMLGVEYGNTVVVELR